MTLYEKYSTNTVSFDNLTKNFSPTFAPDRNQNIFKQNIINNNNMSYSKKINVINNSNEYMNNTFNFDNENNLDNYVNKDYENEPNNLKKEMNKDIKLINIYRKKLLNLFIWHLKNFYKLQFKKLFKEVINIIKMNINFKEHNFEDKTIKNIAILKKELKNNSYYYGYKKQYNYLLKDKTKKVITKEIDNINDNNKINIQNPTFEENVIINDDENLENKNNYDMKAFSDKKNINKKIFRGNNNLLKTDKKYTKKIVTNGVYGKKIVKQQFKKLNIVKQNENIIENNQKKLFVLNEKSPIIHKRLKFPKSSINEKKIQNSGIKIIDNHLNNLEKNNIKSDEENSEKNINIKTDINENKNKIIQDNFEIDKNAVYTIKSQYEEKDNNNNEINNSENDIENYSNKNLENAISIITKVIENKEKSEKEYKKESLIKIITKIINKEKFNLLKRYFNKLKEEKNEILFEEKIKIKESDLLNNLNHKPKLKNKKLKKTLFLSDVEDNKEHNESNIENNSYKSEDDDKNRKKRKYDKIRIIMKQIKLKSNIINDYQNDFQRPKTPKRDNKICFIQDNNNKTPKIIIKKTINIILNKLDKQNIKKEEEKSNEDYKLEEINKGENNEEIKMEEIEINDIKEQVEKVDNIENKNENEPEMDLDIDKNNFSIEDNEKIIENKFDKEFSIESFTKYRKSKAKQLIKNEDEEEDNINEPDITLTEKYQDCENFVYFLRTQLIYYFLANKNSDDSFLD